MIGGVNEQVLDREQHGGHDRRCDELRADRSEERSAGNFQCAARQGDGDRGSDDGVD